MSGSCARQRSTCWSVSSTKAEQTLGWRREVEFARLVEMMVESDLDLLRRQAR